MFFEKYQTDVCRAGGCHVYPFTRLPPLRYFSVSRSMPQNYLISCMSQSPVPGTPSSRLPSLSSHSLSNTTTHTSTAIMEFTSKHKPKLSHNIFYHGDKQFAKVQPKDGRYSYTDIDGKFCSVKLLSFSDKLNLRSFPIFFRSLLFFLRSPFSTSRTSTTRRACLISAALQSHHHVLLVDVGIFSKI